MDRTRLPGLSPAGLGTADWKRSIADKLYYTLARFPAVATANDRYLAVALAVRDRLLERWLATASTYAREGSRTVCYLSAEFLLGPHLANNLLNLGVEKEVRQAVAELGYDLDEVIAQEEEPGLGNGGLGRLAACYLDSLATQEIAAIGYGIRYEYGIFDQTIRDGWQVETTDNWLRLGNPWEIPRPEIAFPVLLGGRTERIATRDGGERVVWLPDRVVKGVAYDTPILGYRVNTANMLRLWSAQASEAFDFGAFNEGDYYRAVERKTFSETITKVLYPNDETAAGKQLRLEQQFFFVTCALQDMIRIHLQRARDLESFDRKYAIQLNDTHPAIAVAELMRLLVDACAMPWERAWEITTRTFGYTNHTLLPEALEKWPLPLFQSVLPRHLEIVYEINRRFLDEVRASFPGDEGKVQRVSLIDETAPRYVRMANLACVGSHRINGVARLHSELLRDELLRDFREIWPDKFTNVTNGVTPRRFVALVNPRLAALVTSAIGDGWVSDLERLRELEPLAEDAAFRAQWRAVKLANKEALAAEIRERAGVEASPDTLFDVQVKRIHEYKRQHLNVLHVAALHERLRRDPSLAAAPRTVVFGGKAAPGYRTAKLVIKLVHSVAAVVNADPAVAGRLRVAFLPDYNVTNCGRIFPAAELSEQISTAGKEASGTGNMKFSLNGALTIGTLDGANVEIREDVGPENFFLFGLTVEEVAALRARGYRPRDHYERDEELRSALDRIGSGFYSNGDASLFRPLVDSLLNDDPFLLLADFRAYVDAQDAVSRAWRDEEHWTRMSILNVARMGRFSSDRSIRDYCRLIWDVEPQPIVLG
ncbi:MAG: glycogen/starch/alpha-glucan phosphorylase [Vicinamibacteria bacterium]